MEGLINLNKPSGPTSHDMVDKVRRLLRQRRVGHGGTLDPLAQGVLPIGVGRATRLLSFLQQGEKVYLATVRLGITTNTYDAAGEVTAEHPPPPLSRDEIERALVSFIGEIDQLPPPFSAVRQQGRHLYELARAGEAVTLSPRRVYIARIELLAWSPPDLVIRVVCGSGTYIRSLAHDLGQLLGCGAYLLTLVREQVGPLRLEQAVTLEQLAEAAAAGRAEELLLPLDLAVQHWPAVHVDEAQAELLANGRGVVDLAPPGEWMRAYGPDGSFLALLRWDSELALWRPERVFLPVEAEKRGS